MSLLKKLCLSALVIIVITLVNAPDVYARTVVRRSWDNIEDVMVLCVSVLIIVAGFYALYRIQKKTIAKIPEEFKYIYVRTANFIAIDLRNQKMLLALDIIRTRKMYDFADIQGYERATKKYTAYHIGRKKRTWYYLILHVNDQANPTWQFGSGDKDEMDCAELLVSRALNGTLPDSVERRVLNLRNLKKFKLFLSQDTWEQE